ncbi:hypothetical protein LEP1GSC170_4306 [Leptospira interrogans serovar Bataviae str. HAI135]|nr:hypothetical protein LEP1GSC170_4306 [Leptospira interrogans serovar Bataviae str. HAI135]
MGTTSNYDFTDKSLKCGNYYFKKILSHFLHKLTIKTIWKNQL